MPHYAALQLLAVFITAILVISLTTTTSWLSVVYALGFSHYLLALIYAHRRVTSLVARPANWVPILLVSGIGFGLYQQGVHLFWYFLIHHVFNEVYLRQRFCPIEGNDSVLALRSTALILHVLAYLTLIRGPIGVSNDYIAPLIMALGLSFLVYIGLLVRLRSNLTFATLANNVVLELVVLGLLPLAVTIGITFEQVVCYHFVFWALMPTLRIPQSGTPWFVGYAVLAITTTVLFLAISPIGFRSMQIPVYLFSTQFILWSYAHITLSFVVSSAHPVWIRTWFEPKAQIPG